MSVSGDERFRVLADVPPPADDSLRRMRDAEHDQ